MTKETVGMLGILVQSTASCVVGFGRLSHNFSRESIINLLV